MSKSKHWCFTVNNYTEQDVAYLTALATDIKPPLVYLVFGKEKGTNETPHLQGFISFTKRKTLKSVKELVNERGHYEAAKGSPHQAAVYCKKDGDYTEFGHCPAGQGHRTNLVEIAEKCRGSVELSTIAEEHPAAFLRYAGNIIKLKHLYRPDRRGQPTINVFWGRTGTGKSRRVWEYTRTDKLWVSSGTRWFDGYDGHPAVLFDDFTGGWFEISYLLKLLDRYPFPVPVKGGFTWWCPKTIYITSNITPKEWYPNASEYHKAALKRRLREFGEVIECYGYP